MLLGSVACGHSNDGPVAFGKGSILVGKVVVGLGVRPGDDVHGSPAEHETKESFKCFVPRHDVIRCLVVRLHKPRLAEAWDTPFDQRHVHVRVRENIVK